ncbi:MULTISPECIES: hypothetical protein [unclassified Paraburkholderia]|uniref:hypothetical protein n=1 Tax=unclassified Paraburkholderia TaxID=2615204 RepID=UPI002AAF3CF2|nr:MULTISPECIES: hypothetical protein [unclassified Paraburkholderia]
MSGQPFIQKARATRILSGALAHDPIADLGLRNHIKETRQLLEEYTLVLERKREMGGERFDWPHDGGVGFLDAGAVMRSTPLRADFALDRKRLNSRSAVAFSQPAIAHPILLHRCTPEISLIQE